MEDDFYAVKGQEKPVKKKRRQGKQVEFKIKEGKGWKQYTDDQINFIRGVFQGVTPLALSQCQLDQEEKRDLVYQISSCCSEVLEILRETKLPIGTLKKKIQPEYSELIKSTRHLKSKNKHAEIAVKNLMKEIKKQNLRSSDLDEKLIELKRKKDIFSAKQFLKTGV